ncbi:MAG: PQQ-dependent sugar dehydrogenase [Rhodospirillales bacterium]
MRRIPPILLFVLFVITAAACGAEPPGGVFPSEKGPVRVVTVANGLENPWGLVFLPDGRMLVTERPGRMRIVGKDGTLLPPLAGLPAICECGQGGLLDVALDPKFTENRLVYFSFADGDVKKEGAATSVARGKLMEDRLDDVRVIFQQLPKISADDVHHFGSRLVFAPDGTLFVTLGERFQKPEAQNLQSDLGKLVRINPDGSIPADNPFVGRTDARPEIYSYGHRNVQGATLNPATHRLWTIEHGAMGGDEINVPEAGKNYGWPVITYGRDYTGLKIGEGTAKEGMEQPIHYWDPSIAPSGALFYTADRFPGWKNNLFIGSLKFELLVRLELDGTKVTHEERLLQKLEERIRDVRQGPDGFLYLLTDNPEGRILRLEPAT